MLPVPLKVKTTSVMLSPLEAMFSVLPPYRRTAVPVVYHWGALLFEPLSKVSVTPSFAMVVTTSWFSFPNMEAGVKGYFDFINITNYAKTKGETDPQKYLQALKDASYATSIDYVQKNMNVIKKYNLTQYDPEYTKVVVPRKIKVAVDAGHGSNTAGKRTPDDYREHWINVNTAFFLTMALEANGFEVYKSGWNDNNSKDDPDTALSVRQKNIKAEQCDCSISCHANAAGVGGWSAASGVETLIHSNPAYQADSKLTVPNMVGLEIKDQNQN